jgi:hypothetical protein
MKEIGKSLITRKQLKRREKLSNQSFMKLSPSAKKQKTKEELLSLNLKKKGQNGHLKEITSIIRKMNYRNSTRDLRRGKRLFLGRMRN